MTSFEASTRMALRAPAGPPCGRETDELKRVGVVAPTPAGRDLLATPRRRYAGWKRRH
jgi:hypothetical protein